MLIELRPVNTTYQYLIEQVDALAAALSRHYTRHLVCRAGCSGCCHHHLSVFAVEAENLREAFELLPEELRSRVKAQAREVVRRESQGEPVACPMLIDDRCSIYASRPLICRTQGLPLLMETEDGRQEVDFCPLNFTAPDALDDLDEQHLVPLDPINMKLALVNLQFCRENGIESEASGKRVTMSEVILGSRHSVTT